jgi:peptidoglycan/LPS O-acetylase OafA/YrhL
MAQKKLLHKLEAIRGFAALYVVFHHKPEFVAKVSPYLAHLFAFGQEAVMLFFILSGFVIQYSFELSGDKSFKTFFFKRFNRIYIPLIIVMIANVLINLIEHENFLIDIKNLLGNLFMLQDVSRVTNIICTPFLGNSPLWSLAYEWWFYMIFFAFTTYFGQNARKFIYIAGIVAALTYLIFPFWFNRIFMYIIVWNIGASTAMLYLNKKAINFNNMKWPLLYLGIAVCILAVNYILNRVELHKQLNVVSKIGFNTSPFIEFRHFIVALVFISGGIIWHRLKWKGFKYTIGLFEFVAPISYCIYICHFFLLVHATYLNFIGNEFVEYILYFIITLLFSYVVERIIYPPANKLLMKHIAKKTPVEAPIR